MYLCVEEGEKAERVESLFAEETSSRTEHGSSGPANGNLPSVEKVQKLILERLEVYNESHEVADRKTRERLRSVEAVLLEVQTALQRLLTQGTRERGSALRRKVSIDIEGDEPLPNEQDPVYYETSDTVYHESLMDEPRVDGKAPNTSDPPFWLHSLADESNRSPPRSLSSRSPPRQMSPRVQSVKDSTVDLDTVVLEHLGPSDETSPEVTEDPEDEGRPMMFLNKSGTGSVSVFQTSSHDHDLWAITQSKDFSGMAKASLGARFSRAGRGAMKKTFSAARSSAIATASQSSAEPLYESTNVVSFSQTRPGSQDGVEGISSTEGQASTTPGPLPFGLLPIWERVMDSMPNKTVEEDSDSDSDDSDVSTHLPQSAAWAMPKVYQRQRAQSRLGESPKKEKCLDKYMGGLIMSPWSSNRTVWDVMAISFISWDAVSLPMEAFPLESNWFFMGMAWSATVYWTVDLLVGCITGYAEPRSDRVELRPIPVLVHYAKTWLLFNIVAVSPDWIAIGMGGAGGVDTEMHGMGRSVRVVRALRILRLLRLFKMRRLIIAFEKRFNNDYLMCYLNLVKLMICMACLVHYLACGWYGVSDLEDEHGWAAQAAFDSTAVGYKYLSSLHWALTQFQGSMEVHPHTTIERAYAVLVLYLGIIAAGGFISTITNSMTRIQQIYAENNSRRWLLLRYLSDNHISGVLSLRVKNWVEKALRDERTSAGAVELLKILPEDLRMDLELDSKREVFKVHPLLYFLTQADMNLARHLSISLDSIRAHPQEPLFEIDILAEGMYIILSGKLQYLGSAAMNKALPLERSKSVLMRATSRATFALRPTTRGKLSSVPQIIEPRSTVCEMALWMRWDHRGTCKAISIADVYCVGTDKFREAVVNHSQQGIRVVRYAINFVTWMNKMNMNGTNLDDMSSPLKMEDDDNDSEN